MPLVSNTSALFFCENSFLFVENIGNTLGFNKYTLADLDSGRKLNKNRHELQIPDITTIDNLNIEMEDLKVWKTEEMEKNGIKKLQSKSYMTIPSTEIVKG